MDAKTSGVLAVLDDELIKARSRGDDQGHAYLRAALAHCVPAELAKEPQ